MYMIAFVTLLVALIGMFTQVYTKQAMSGLAQQTRVVDEMRAWHATAMGLASSLIKNGSLTSAGCGLYNPNIYKTTTLGVPPLAGCSLPTGVTGDTNTVYVWTTNPTSASLCAGDVAPPCYTPLPAGYSTTYTFYSIAYASGGTNYVITYAPPPTTSSDNYGLGLLCLPGNSTGAPGWTCASPHASLPFMFEDLYKQMGKNPLLSRMYYGSVTTSALLCGSTATPCLTTPTVPSISGGAAAPIVYPVPVSVPPGSIGIISEASPCTNCL